MSEISAKAVPLPSRFKNPADTVSKLFASYAIAIPIAVAIELEIYAEEHSIKAETAIVEALRAYVGER